MSKIRLLQEKSVKGKGLSKEEAEYLVNLPDSETFELISAANEIREHFKGKKIKFCSIVNAKSGKCPEDCSYCAQSAHHKTKIEVYPLMTAGEIFNKAKKAEKEGGNCFGIVTSGKGIGTDREINEICRALSKMKDLKLNKCVSLGILTKEQLRQLKAAGAKKFHHNLETSKSNFRNVCTTHGFNDRVRTVKAAKEAGLSVCCGGIFGLGETLAQRVELAFNIKELDPDSIPINFLNPIKGTRSEKYPLLKPLEALRIIAMFRFVMPKKDIVICGGREVTLRSLQPLMFIAGANMALMGDYLTTAGNSPEEDLKMAADLGLKVSG